MTINRLVAVFVLMYSIMLQSFMLSADESVEKEKVKAEKVSEEKDDESVDINGAQIGGYGELHYNTVFDEDGEHKKSVLDFHRFVLMFSYQWNENWSFVSELELEHAFVQGEFKGELELEQALIDYWHSDYFGFNVGILLAPIGGLNHDHEPPKFLEVERPNYSKYIIPTTWFGAGLSFYGNIFPGLQWRVTAMEGLSADGISEKSGIRGARQKAFKTPGSPKYFLYTGTLNYSSMGFKVGASYSYNRAKGTDVSDAELHLVEGHIRFNGYNFRFASEAAYINYNNAVIDASFGYYVNLGYNFAGLFNTNVEVTPFLSWNDYSPSFDPSPEKVKTHYRELTAGLSFKPQRWVVFKADYTYKMDVVSDSFEHLLNIGTGFMF